MFEIYYIVVNKLQNNISFIGYICFKLGKFNYKFTNTQSSPSMPGLKSLFKKRSRSQSVRKPNIQSIFNYCPNERKTINDNLLYNCSQKRIQSYQQIFQNQIIDLQKLKKLAWNGIPQQYRAKVWRVLLKYSSTNRDNRQQLLKLKRSDYFHFVQSYIESPTIEQDYQQKKTVKLISDDAIRTLPESALFRHQKVQTILKRVLLIWHIKHPVCGYVQGINDVVTPFILVFLSEYIKNSQNPLQLSQQNLKNVQADCYWCLTKVLDKVMNNYTQGWPGIQKSFQKAKQIINRVDPQLLKHFQEKGIEFYHIFFKWQTCLLLRQFNTKTGLRLFDTYLAIGDQFYEFSLYLVASILLKFSKNLKAMSFEQLMNFQQKMPTKLWDQQQLSTALSEAFVYQNYFRNI